MENSRGGSGGGLRVCLRKAQIIFQTTPSTRVPLALDAYRKREKEAAPPRAPFVSPQTKHQIRINGSPPRCKGSNPASAISIVELILRHLTDDIIVIVVAGLLTAHPSRNGTKYHL